MQHSVSSFMSEKAQVSGSHCPGERGTRKVQAAGPTASRGGRELSARLRAGRLARSEGCLYSGHVFTRPCVLSPSCVRLCSRVWFWRRRRNLEADLAPAPSSSAPSLAVSSVLRTSPVGALGRPVCLRRHAFTQSPKGVNGVPWESPTG